MDEQHSMQIKELAERIVGSSHGLGAFLAANANADVGLGNHRAVIGAVANRHGNPWTVSLAQGHNVRLLLRRNTTADY